MTSATAARDDSIDRRDILRRANRLWVRAGVRRADRQLLIAELDSELAGAHHDGRSPAAVLGEDREEMLRLWAHERGMCGRALRLALVVPAALIGIVAGLAVVLGFLVAGFSGGSGAVDPGPLVLPFYASGGALAYLCALLCVWGVLRRAGDPHVAPSVRWLAVVLPLSAVLSTGAGVAVAWWSGFTTSSAVFVAVTAVVIAGLGVTVGASRYLALRRAADSKADSV